MATARIPLPVLGIDMLSEGTKLRAGAVRSAVNVDIDRDGRFQRRAGFATVLPGADFHSIHASAHGLLVGNGPNLFRIAPATLEPTFVCAMGSADPVSFCEYNGATYAANAGRLVRIDATGARDAAVEPPQAPDVVPSEAGTLRPGRYGVALSAVRDGEESPAVFLGEHDLQAGLRLEGLAPGRSYRLYITPQNGDVLYLADEFTAFLTGHTPTLAAEGAPCQTLHMAPMPAGHIVRGARGRLYVARGPTLWYSQALRPHLMAPRHDFIPFVGRILFMEPVDDGLFVADARGVWFLAGADPDATRMEFVSPVGVVSNSAVVVPATVLPAGMREQLDDAVVWLSEHGYMVGRSGGAVIPLHPDRVRVAPGQEGRSVALQRDGINQVITLTAAPSRATFGIAHDTFIQ